MSAVSDQIAPASEEKAPATAATEPVAPAASNPHLLIDQMISTYLSKDKMWGIKKLNSEYPELSPQFEPNLNLCRYRLAKRATTIARYMNDMIVDIDKAVIVNFAPEPAETISCSDALKRLRDCDGPFVVTPIFEGFVIYVFYMRDHWMGTSDAEIDASKDDLCGTSAFDRFRSVINIDELNKNYCYTFIVHENELMHITGSSTFAECLFTFNLETNTIVTEKGEPADKLKVRELIEETRAAFDHEATGARIIGYNIRYGKALYCVYKQFFVDATTCVQQDVPIYRLSPSDVVMYALRINTTYKVAFYFYPLRSAIAELVKAINGLAAKIVQSVNQDTSIPAAPVIQHFVQQLTIYKRMTAGAFTVDVSSITKMIIADPLVLCHIMENVAKLSLKKLK